MSKVRVSWNGYEFEVSFFVSTIMEFEQQVERARAIAVGVLPGVDDGVGEVKDNAYVQGGPSKQSLFEQSEGLKQRQFNKDKYGL